MSEEQNSTFDLTTRIETHLKLSTALAYLNNAQLQQLIENDSRNERSWASNYSITVGGSKVFVKTVPLTDIEYRNQFSTKNLYDLPPVYSYGVGSAGFSAFRELLTHIKTTNWVLAGEIENFPLLYHYRIQRRSAEITDLDEEKHARFIAYWADNENIGTHTRDRHNAEWELVLFLEHIPFKFSEWIMGNLDQSERVTNELSATIAFLRQQGVIHFDVHFGNILSDGARPYLTDFGLTMDEGFELSEAERAFLKRHTEYDYAALFVNLGWILWAKFKALDEAKQEQLNQQMGINASTSLVDGRKILLDNAARLHLDGTLQLDQTYLDLLDKYKDVFVWMLTFFTAMQKNNQKDTVYEEEQLKQLLIDAGVLDGMSMESK